MVIEAILFFCALAAPFLLFLKFAARDTKQKA